MPEKPHIICRLCAGVDDVWVSRGTEGVERFAQAVGRILRRARKERGLTLRDVREHSSGRFKASSVGSYERGARNISLERFCELAAIYGVPADQLLAQVLAERAPEARRHVVIDLNRLSLVDEDERRLIGEFVHEVKARRGDYVTDVITLRSGDVEALAQLSGMKPRILLGKMEAALRAEDG